MIRQKTKKAQSILEYVTLLAVVLASLLIMQVYIKRSYCARIKQEADTAGGQYSPGHTNSTIITKTATQTVSYTGGETSSADLGIVPEGEEVPDGMSVIYSSTQTSFNRTEEVDSFGDEK